MKAKVLFTILLLGILPCFAHKSFFGLTLGQTTFTQAKEILQKQGISFYPYNNRQIYSDNPIQLSGYYWNNFNFYFEKDTGFYFAKFEMEHPKEIDTVYRNLRDFLVSKYSDYKIVNSGLERVRSSCALTLQSDRLEIQLILNYSTQDIILWYEYLKKPTTPYSSYRDEL